MLKQPTREEIEVLVLIATIGHAMALLWFVAVERKWKITEKVIYDMPIKRAQLRRELINSVHAPLHAVILLIFLLIGSFPSRSLASFTATLAAVTVWAEVWHYISHRAMHWPSLHWIHVEHHKSRLNTPFTAISFSFCEKLIFDLGLVSALAIVDRFFSLNVFGICAWYIGYLVINSYSHANYELKSSRFTETVGKVLTSTTYHSLHHSRYHGNFGLGTRFMDRIFHTEWMDYEDLYTRVTRDRKPLSRLAQRAHEDEPRAVSSR